MIAVCLLTAGRVDYTTTTLESFSAFAPSPLFSHLLHADDASRDPKVRRLSAAHGFTTVFRSKRRLGWLPMRRRLFAEAQSRGAQWVLFLENDVEWARPFPSDLFTFIASRPEIYCLRLHGEYKDRERLDPCLRFNKADRTSPVEWTPLAHAPESAEVARIHWSAQPSVTRTGALIDLHYSRGVRALTARVVDNVTYHIGFERTSGWPPVQSQMEASA